MGNFCIEEVNDEGFDERKNKMQLWKGKISEQSTGKFSGKHTDRMKRDRYRCSVLVAKSNSPAEKVSVMSRVILQTICRRFISTVTNRP
jgi:hypothetical protein